jgi:2-isopropylmalate synthase
MLGSLLRRSFGAANAASRCSPSLAAPKVPHGRRSLSASGTVDGKDKLVIFDTTLRDGEQSPGATLSFNEKLTIARHLSAMGIDVCEAGFPIASNGDFDAVKAIAEQIGPNMEGREAIGAPMTICGLSRANFKDIDRCFDAVRHAPKHRIHTFIATSDLHLEYKLKMTRAECIAQAIKAVTHAKTLCEDVEFSAEDAGRSDPAYLADMMRAVVEAGATTLNIPDTVGYVLPVEYRAMIEGCAAALTAEQRAAVVFSTHCHDDLGLATANTLAGVEGGARQVEVTVNGIGERAGNTSLEEILMILHTRPQMYPMVAAQCNVSGITRASTLVSRFTGMVVQPNKAIVGANAFAHEAGIHQDGVLKKRETYEIMDPTTVGLNSNSLVLGKHSGRAAYRDRLSALGYAVSDEDLDEVVEKCKAIADEKKVVTDEDVEAVVTDRIYKPKEAVWSLKTLHVTSGNVVKPTATISLLRADGCEVTHAAVGTGPIDAVYQAVTQATGVRCSLVDFQIQSTREGATKALGVVTVKIAPKSNPEGQQAGGMFVSGAAHAKVNAQTGQVMKREYSGRGTSTDIIEASTEAYVNALNRMLNAEAGSADFGEVSGSIGSGSLYKSTSWSESM